MGGSSQQSHLQLNITERPDDEEDEANGQTAQADHLLLPPAEGCVVEVCPEAAHHATAVEYQPGHGQDPPPLLAGAAQDEEDVDEDGEDWRWFYVVLKNNVSCTYCSSHQIQPFVWDLFLN